MRIFWVGCGRKLSCLGGINKFFNLLICFALEKYFDIFIKYLNVFYLNFYIFCDVLNLLKFF